MATVNPRSPTHRAYAVTENGGRRYWREIGAAWTHADGEGMNLKLDYLPLNGADIVIRKPNVEGDQQIPESDEGTEVSRASGRRARAGTPSPT